MNDALAQPGGRTLARGPLQPNRVLLSGRRFLKQRDNRLNVASPTHSIGRRMPM